MRNKGLLGLAFYFSDGHKAYVYKAAETNCNLINCFINSKKIKETYCSFYYQHPTQIKDWDQSRFSWKNMQTVVNVE